MMKSIFNKIKNIKWNKRKTTLALIVFLIIGLTILRFSYGYLGPVTIGASKNTAQVSTTSLDELKLENSREMVFEDFEPDDPEYGVVYATATLVPNSDTNYASKTYNVYLLVKNSNSYTQANMRGGIDCGLVGENGNWVDGTRSGVILDNLSGHDRDGLYQIASNYTISTSLGESVTQTWRAFLNFDDYPANPVSVTYQIILSETPINNLYDTLALQSMPDNESSTYVTNSSGVQFNAISSDTNGRGLYYLWGSEDYGDYPVYYYRGNVDNNNVIFNNFCWKIVRTTETGGVKLIYNGVPSSGKCTTQTGTGTQISGTYLYNNKSPDSSGNANSPAFEGYMYGSIYRAAARAISASTKYYYGAGFTYASSKYTLTSATAQTWSSWYNNATFKSRHYTNFQTATGAYSPIYYIHYVESGRAYYITISGANTTIQTAISQMLTSSSNATSSTAKDAVDSWYNTNMNTTAVNNKLEDTIWCNDRGIGSLGGFNPNGGPVYSTSGYGDVKIMFSPYGRLNNSPSLFTCSKNDSFTVSDSTNGNAKLTYKTGLITSDELMYAGAKWYNANGNSMYLYTGQSYWTMSPCAFGPINATIFVYDNTGQLYWSTTSTSTPSIGIRPMVSLKHDTTYSSGVGTKDEPYVIS